MIAKRTGNRPFLLYEQGEDMDFYTPLRYQAKDVSALTAFLEKCLPESGRALDLSGRHSFYLEIPNYFLGFWCLYDESGMIGTVGIRELSPGNCELKSLYLLEKYHGKGYGRMLLDTAVDAARKLGYQKMYLDSLLTSTKALKLYRRAGFLETERYNDAVRSDIFMVKDL